jgi:hypothetical protein
MQPPSPIRLMWLLFLGFALSLAFGLFSAAIIYAVDGQANAQSFLVLYIGPFNTLVTLGLILGTALIIGSSQTIIPDTIKAAFPNTPLPDAYTENNEKYISIPRTIIFASELIIISFIIFQFCRFPLSGLAEGLMIVAGCGQWALASYVGRKLRYAGMMLQSLLTVPVTDNLFKPRKLDVINTSVNIASTLTVMFVYLLIRSYYAAPFVYDSFIGRSAQVFLLLPAVLATPVLLIFNFYPREVVRKIYHKSIDIEVEKLKEEIRNEALTEFEKKLRLMEVEKMHREELRYSLQLTLSDLPIGITILIMLVEPLIKS